MRKALLLSLALSLAALAAQQTSENLDTKEVQIAKAEIEKPKAPKVEKKKIEYQYVDTDTGRWLIHDINRPTPPIITPDEPGKPFKDVTVLFTGKDLTGWTDRKEGPSKWIVKDGVMESVKKSGPIMTEQKFGSCQLHVEFKTPTPVKGSSQGRGNSGVFLMNEYEIQVLDSYDNRTYADGQCGALYGRAVPEVNASRRPGQWQSYDIIFYRPIFKDGKVVRKARFTVFHNGILIHYDVHLQGGTQWKGPHKISDYNTNHPDKGPISLQDHGNPVQFRNIWIRELEN